jgi:hypothetical protein
VPCFRPSPCTYPIKKCPRFRKGIFSLLSLYSIEFRNRLRLPGLFILTMAGRLKGAATWG